MHNYLYPPTPRVSFSQLASHHSYSLVSADHSFMCVPSSLLACACLCDAISHMAPERLSACVETLAQLAGLEKVRTCLYHFVAAVCMCACGLNGAWFLRTLCRRTVLHVYSHGSKVCLYTGRLYKLLSFMYLGLISDTRPFKVWASHFKWLQTSLDNVCSSIGEIWLGEDHVTKLLA